MKIKIEFENDNVANESAVDSAEITAPQATGVQQVADVVDRITRSTIYTPVAILGSLIEGHLRLEDFRRFAECLSPDTRTLLISYMQEVETQESPMVGSRDVN